jgi:O-antigen/teichoic acid export membrane protein
MGKFKLFIENFIVYGLGGVISKLIPLIMLPIVTRLMPDTTYYGLSDLSNSVVQFGCALAIMGMYDAVFRMFFEKEDEDYQKDVCSTALVFTLAISVVIFLLLIIFRIPMSQLIFSDPKYSNLLFLTAMSILIGGTNSIVMIPTRTQNKRRIYISMNIMTSLVSYSISIPLLLAGNYIIALPLAAVISAFSTEAVFWSFNRSWFNFKRFDKKILKQLLIIGVPLLPNFLIYWIFNSSDRIMIAKLLGNSFVGVYSVGSKLGNASQLIYTAFAGGWQYFAFSTMKDDNQVESNSIIFEYLGVISFIAGCFMCAWSYLIFNILFEGDYVEGYVVAPYLFLAPLLQMLFQVACNQFLVIKKTWPNMLILSFGAIINIIFNLVFIPLLGVEGAGISTLIGYAVSDIICVIILCKMKLMIVSGRFLIVSASTIGYILIWRIFFRENFGVSTLLALVITIFFVSLYKKDLLSLIRGERK